MARVQVSEGIYVPDRGYGGNFEVTVEDMGPDLTTTARSYFEEKGVLVSPTADRQRWQVPGTEGHIPADAARTLSHEVRRELGRVSL